MQFSKLNFKKYAISNSQATNIMNRV